MKNTKIFWIYFSISIFSTSAFAQIIGQNYTAIVKTNVLIFRDAQQWSLSLETKTKKPKQTNNYTIGYNLLLGNGERIGKYAAYARRFYLPPLFFILLMGKSFIEMSTMTVFCFLVALIFNQFL